MTDPSSSARSVFYRPVVVLSGILLLGAAAWNVKAGDGVDGLFLLGLGIGGALLAGARGQADGSSAPVLRWTGIALLVTILLVQLGMLLRYLFLL